MDIQPHQLVLDDNGGLAMAGTVSLGTSESGLTLRMAYNPSADLVERGDCAAEQEHLLYPEFPDSPATTAAVRPMWCLSKVYVLSYCCCV